MEKKSQAWLLENGPTDMRGAILKVAHHGSDRTTDLAFLAALDPEVAVLSAGRRNRFGHPGPGNLATLRAGGSRILLTPIHGAVEWRRDRLGSRWRTFLPEAPDRQAGTLPLPGAAGRN
jgi:competence protein ComEC